MTISGQAGTASRYAHYEWGRDLDYYEADPNLRFVLEGHLEQKTLQWSEQVLHDLGGRCGSDIARRADQTDRLGHRLVRYDRYGRDVSRIEYAPGWLANLDEVLDFGLVGWNHDPERLSRYGRAPVPLLAAFDYLVGQAEMALCCPVELAHGGVFLLERFADAELRERLLPPIVSTDRRSRLQVANVFTEIQAGSDLATIRTTARQSGKRWHLTGEKWFASNPGADLIVTAARPMGGPQGTRGLAAFFVPSHRADGELNGVSIRRLKDKMGTVGVPTGELIFEDAEAYLVGDCSRPLMAMLNVTRFWNAVGALGVMRRSLLEAAVYATRREAFGGTLDRLPMVRETLVSGIVALEATTALVMEAAAALERSEEANDPHAELQFRTFAPLVKYRTGEENVQLARMAVELLGGNGAVADFGTPRLLRDAQINTIWEGTSNICALDLWRATTRLRGHDALLERCEGVLDEVRAHEAERLAETSRELIKATRRAVEILEGASQARQHQQARRFADLLGDAVALALLTREADRAALAGDYRKALVATLFGGPLRAARSGVGAVTDGFQGVPDAYSLLFSADGCARVEYRAVLRRLGMR